MEENNSNYSPFDAPVKEPKTLRPETSGGMKMEQITDAELDGKKDSGPPPTDAPAFEIPNFNEIPNMGGEGGFAADPNAPGSGPAPSGGGSGGSGGGGTAGDGTKVDPGFMKDFSDFSAKWLVDIFFRLLVNALRQFAKIDKAEVTRAVELGQIDARFLTYVDDVNDKADKKIYVTDDEKKFVIEPLKYFLEVKKIQLKPEWMFITGLLFVGGSVAVRAWDMKQSNKELLDHMIKESAKWREQDRVKNNQNAGNGGGNGGRGGSGFYESVENFSPNGPNSGGGYAPPPSSPSSESNIEVVPTEEIDNDDN